jgi:hypothetical protein
VITLIWIIHVLRNSYDVDLNFRAAPRAAPAPARQAAPVPARAPQAQPPAPMMAAPSQGPGIMGQMAATAGGVAIGSVMVNNNLCTIKN